MIDASAAMGGAKEEGPGVARRQAAGEIVIQAIAADGSFYPIEKLEAHRQGAKHLAVSVFVFSGAELLIQRRAAVKYHCPLLWANSCCSHPNWGESVQACAERRLREELGLHLPVREVARTEYHAPVGQGLSENEQVHIFIAEVDKRALQISPNPAEVCETRWVTAGQLREMVAARPEEFTPWIRIYLRRWPDLKIA